VPDFHFNNDTLNFIVIYKIEIVLIILFVILHFISYKKGNLSEKISNIKLRYWFIFLTTIILAILFSYDGHPSDFIYFQF
jgi:hypothetical protein